MACLLKLWYIIGSSPGQMKPKTDIFYFSNLQHKWVRAKIKLGIGIMHPNGVINLPAVCCYSELALLNVSCFSLVWLPVIQYEPWLSIFVIRYPHRIKLLIWINRQSNTNYNCLFLAKIRCLSCVSWVCNKVTWFLSCGDVFPHWGEDV